MEREEGVACATVKILFSNLLSCRGTGVGQEGASPTDLGRSELLAGTGMFELLRSAESARGLSDVGIVERMFEGWGKG